MNLLDFVRNIPDFPIPGILFRDISPLLKSPAAMKAMADQITQTTNLDHIDAFAGIESRGFILASYLAAKFDKGFIPLRKAGKLPPPTLRERYTLEYGTAELEIGPGTERIMLIDDVLATGGTLQAAMNLCEHAGYSIEQVAVLINLTSLNQLRFKGHAIHSVIQY